MKKEQVKVIINNHEEAEQAKSILTALGQKTNIDFYYKNQTKIDQTHLFLSQDDGIWLCYRCYQSEPLCVVTLKELVIILSKEVCIKKPIFVMKSIDGVDLFVGDKVYEVNNKLNGDWYLVNANCGLGYWIVDLNPNTRLKTDQENSKAFSTKEAAEKWIKENNNPSKELIFNRFLKATIDNSGVLIENTATGMKQLIFKSEMNKIIESYESF